MHMDVFLVLLTSSGEPACLLLLAGLRIISLQQSSSCQPHRTSGQVVTTRCQQHCVRVSWTIPLRIEVFLQVHRAKQGLELARSLCSSLRFPIHSLRAFLRLRRRGFISELREYTLLVDYMVVSVMDANVCCAVLNR